MSKLSSPLSSPSDPFDSQKKDWEYVQEQKFKSLKQLNQCLERGEATIIISQTKYARGLNRMTFLLDSIGQIATDSRLSDTDRKVLLFMISKMDFENWVPLTQPYMAECLGMRQPHVSRSIKALKEANYILVGKLGRGNAYQFNPEHGWKGEDEKWNNVVDFAELKARQKANGSLPLKPSA